MSDPNDTNDKNLQEQLERITDRESGAAPDLAEEAMRLHESWLAFGRLLDAANDGFDEAALLAKVRTTTVEAAAPSPHSRKSARWLGIVAIAASLLLAAIVWRIATEDREPLARDAQAPAPRIVSADPQPAKTAIAEQYAWDDSLDERIAAAGEQLIFAAGDWRGYDAPYAAVDQRLQNLTDTWDEDNL